MSLRRRRRSSPDGVETITIHDEDPRTGRPVALTAAAQILNGPRIQRSGPPKAGKSVSQPWQAEAWAFYDMIGELRFGMQWGASAVSGVRLIAARVSDSGGDPEPVEEGTPAELVANWAGGRTHQAQVLHRAALQLSVTGDTYIIGRTVDDEDSGETREEWEAYSTEETSYSKADGWMISDGTGKTKVGAEDVMIRCWRPHPRLRSEADTSVRPSLPILRELNGLTMLVMAQIDSRLAGAGLLLLPQGMTFVSAPGQREDDADGVDPFVRELIEAMVTPIKDRDSAASVVPIVARVPDETLGKAQHLKFWDGLDERAKDLRDEAVRRLALSLDSPPEVVLGLSGVNHWNAWAIDEASIKMHVRPLAVTIAWALTIGWFWPALEEAGVDDPEQYMVWVDTSELQLRPDRSGDARELFDRFAVGPDTLRRESGFDAEDAPSDEELGRMVLLRLLDRAPDVRALLQALGLGDAVADADALAPAAPAAPQLPAGGDDTEQRDMPEEPDSGDSGPPQVSASAAVPCDGLECAAHFAVLRALEIVGKRLIARNHRGRYRDLPAYQLHTVVHVPETDVDRLLDQAWNTLSELLGDQGAAVVAAVDGYTRDLLRSGQPHTLDWLRGALRRAAV